MKKKISILLFVFALCLSMPFPTYAADNGFADAYYRVIDMADLLTDSEEATLITELDEISLRQNMDVVVATTDSLEGYSVRDYADTLYDQCGFGYGSNADGLLLLISMEDRDWYISTCGYGITAFTDAGIDYIGEQILSKLSEGEYMAAFEQYGKICDEFITQARSGKPYDKGSLPREPLSMIWIPISLVIGFVIAKIAVGSMKSELKSVRSQAAANSYVKEGSMNVTESRDMFLYHTVTKTEKPKNDSSGGGSSTHRSSSGRTHGGGGGKF